MRYRFKGVRRHNGKPVEGHVHADDQPQAMRVLGDNGILTESLREDPPAASSVAAPAAPPTVSPASPPVSPPASSAPAAGKDRPRQPAPTAARPPQVDLAAQAAESAPPDDGGQGSGETLDDQVADALESAFDLSATQIDFDKIAQRYKGKRVWVLDRDKIKRRVKAVVDKAIQESLKQKENADEARERIAIALDDIFGDSKNLTSEAGQQGAGAGVSREHVEAMEEQIARLTHVVASMEKAMTSISVAPRSAGRGRGRAGGGGGGGGGAPSAGGEQNKVLLQIFETNLELMKGIEAESAPGRKPGDPAAPDNADSAAGDAGDQADQAASGDVGSGEADSGEADRASA